MSETVVDSSIVVDYLRGRRAAQAYLDGLRARDELATHVVVVAEVLAGARNREELVEIDRAVKLFRLLPIDGEDSLASLDLYKRHRLKDGVGWLDCLIAATCLRTSLPIATLNERHFEVFEKLRVVRPY
jgi:tRNA(fMet)-specific endonuclease VapC